MSATSTTGSGSRRPWIPARVSSDEGGGLTEPVVVGRGPYCRSGRAHRKGAAWLAYAGTTRWFGSVPMPPGWYSPGQPHPVYQPCRQDRTGHEYGQSDVAEGSTGTESGSYQRHEHGQYGDPALVHQLAMAGRDD